METIIVPVDGASNIKLEVLDYHTLTPLFSAVTRTPLAEWEGMKYNDSGSQFEWYEKTIAGLPSELKNARVIAPVARGASGGLIGRDGALCEVPGRALSLSYNQVYPERVERAFEELAGGEREFYHETGSILSYPGSLTLLKRFLLEQMERPEVLERADCFAAYGTMLAGHFLGPDYRTAVRYAGNEHGYWMCHSGARDINEIPGTPSSTSTKIESFADLVPNKTAAVYEPLGKISSRQALSLGINVDTLTIPGGHDTCLSHIPVQASISGRYSGKAARKIIHLEAGSWTMVSLIGDKPGLPEDGYRRSVVVQGTVDGLPVVTSMYGGGRDFSYLKALAAEREASFRPGQDTKTLEKVCAESNCFVLPNINPENNGTGPFPEIRGRIVEPERFFADGELAMAISELCMANTAVCQIEALTGDKAIPLVLTGGGSKDQLFSRLLATISEHGVYTLVDSHGKLISETTTLGAAIAGKAACEGVHPDKIELQSVGMSFCEVEPFAQDLKDLLLEYRKKFVEQLNDADSQQ